MLITDSKVLGQYYSEHRIWQGIPGIARTKAGRIFVCFYSGNTKETYGNYAVLIKSEDTKSFSEPIAVAEKIGKYRCFDPVLWLDPLERLWFIWNVMPGEQVMAAICDEPDAQELVWSEEFCIGRGIMMNKPVVLSTGEWLFPIALWRLDIYKELRSRALTLDDVAGSYVYKTSDNGRTFIKLGYADIRDRSFDEHMIYEHNNGTLEMLIRTTYGIGASYSYDRGKKWSKGEKTKLGGPCSRFFISRLSSGRILLINHYKFSGRNNLTALLSDDDGRTFTHSLLLDERDNVSYPDAVEDENGRIYIVYDRERGAYKHSIEEVYDCAREILTACVTEEDIISGELVSKGSYLKRVVSKLGVLSEGDINPFDMEMIDELVLAKELIENETDNIVDRVFELYPRNCTTTNYFDSRKLDGLIAGFLDTDCKDEKLLSEIILFVRKAPAYTQGSHYPIIDSAKDYIEEHITDSFSTSELADALRVSVYYLSHLFKNVTGTTLIEYRNELRLTNSKRLLLLTDLSITEIAAKVGFCTAAYFTEIFTRSEKISPSEYRQFHK